MGNTISFRKEFGLILVGAIIFTASFLWKDFLTDLEQYFFPKGQNLTGRALYTIIVTIILILMAVHLRTVFGLSSSSQSSIKFDDSPIDDNSNIDIGIGDSNSN